MTTFNSKNFVNQTIRLTESQLITNACNLKVDQNIKAQNTNVNSLQVNTKRIEDLTGQVQSFRGYDGLRVIVQQHLDELQQTISQEVKEQSDLIKQYLPLLSLPTNPIAVVKYVKNFTLKDIFPKLNAIIRYTTRIISFSVALIQLGNEVERAIEYLEQFVTDFPDQTTLEAKSALQRLSYNLQATIQNSIAGAICNSLNAKDVGSKDVVTIFRVIDQLKVLSAQAGLANQNVDEVIDSSLPQIAMLQSSMSQITGILPTIDTSSVENYTKSITDGSAAAFLASVGEIAGQEPPRVISEPKMFFANSINLVSEVAVFDNLTVENGTWSGNNITFITEWYSGDNLVFTGDQFQPNTAHIDRPLRATVVAENEVGRIESSTQIIETVTNPFLYLSNSVIPAITGSTSVGQTLSCSTGVWLGTNPTTYSFQWEYARTGESILSANTSSYVISVEDEKRSLRCKVTATNILGSNSIYTSSTSVVI